MINYKPSKVFVDNLKTYRKSLIEELYYRTQIPDPCEREKELQTLLDNTINEIHFIINYMENTITFPTIIDPSEDVYITHTCIKETTQFTICNFYHKNKDLTTDVYRVINLVRPHHRSTKFFDIEGNEITNPSEWKILFDAYTKTILGGDQE